MEQQSFEFLKIFGLDIYKDELAKNLPYGMQRRLEIARALAANPKLLLLDEPAAGMNPQETHDLMELIAFIRKEFDCNVNRCKRCWQKYITLLLLDSHMTYTQSPDRYAE